MPSRRATAWAVVRLSLVSITTRIPAPLRNSIALGVVCLTGSAITSSPATRPSIATKITVPPSARSACLGGLRSRADAGFAHDPVAADHQRTALDRPGHPLADRAVEILRLGQGKAALLRSVDNRCGERMLAARSSEAASRSSSLSVIAPTGFSLISRGLLGQRAGLVDHEGIDPLEALQRAFLITSTPRCAPRPTPTMIDIGVACGRRVAQDS